MANVSTEQCPIDSDFVVQSSAATLKQFKALEKHGTLRQLDQILSGLEPDPYLNGEFPGGRPQRLSYWLEQRLRTL